MGLAYSAQEMRNAYKTLVGKRRDRSEDRDVDGSITLKLILRKSKKKVKLSHYRPWRGLGGEEI
jgi:hypothetical protein